MRCQRKAEDCTRCGGRGLPRLRRAGHGPGHYRCTASLTDRVGSGGRGLTGRGRGQGGQSPSGAIDCPTAIL